MSVHGEGVPGPGGGVCSGGGTWSQGGPGPGGGVPGRGGSVPKGVPGNRGVCSQRGSGPGGCLVGGAWWRPPPDGYCCRRYASYLNAFLFRLIIDERFTMFSSS